MMAATQILIIDDEPEARNVFSEFLTAKGFSVTAASGGREALAMLSKESQDIVLLDLKMPGMDGISVLKAIKEADPALPVIMLTGYGDVSVAGAAMKLGAYEFLLKPPDFDDMLMVINRAIKDQGSPILVVDDTPESLKLLTDILTKVGYQVRSADSGTLALTSVAAHMPRLILLNILMPDMDGFEVMRRLREREESSDIPVMLFSAATDSEKLVEGLRLGAVDFIIKPFQREELIVRVKNHLEMHQLKNRIKRHAAVLLKANEQLQIEIQERKKAEESLRENEAKFKSMVDTLPMAIYLYSGIEQVCEYLNPAFIKLFGYTMEDISGVSQWLLLAYPDEPYRGQLWEEWSTRVKRAIETQSPSEPIESVVTCKDGSEKNILWGYMPIGDKNYVYGLDLTERKLAEEEIQNLNKELEQRVIERTAQLEAINSTLHDEISEHKKSQKKLKEYIQRFELAAASDQLGVWEWNVLSNFMIWNDRMFELYGISRDEFPNSVEAWLKGLHPDDSAKAIAESDAALRGEKEFNTEFRVLHPDGTVKVIKTNAVVIRDTDGKPVRMIGLNRDITELRKMTSELNESNEQLRNLAAHLQSVREEERIKIAREIHDELGQTLTALKMELSWFREKYGDHKSIFDKSGTMLDVISTTIRAVRRMCTELRPSILDDFGLIEAMRWQADEFQRRTRIECTVDSAPEDINLDKELCTALFRIFQEALTNVLKHTRATEVTSILTKDGDNITLEIIDNGKGIRDEELSKPQSYGLLGMRERVHPWGGKVEISLYKNRGTKLKVSIPLLV